MRELITFVIWKNEPVTEQLHGVKQQLHMEPAESVSELEEMLHDSHCIEWTRYSHENTQDGTRA